jgi:hypothetical protein
VPSRRRSRAADTMAPAFVFRTITQGALPEICQKLRYAQPRGGPTTLPSAAPLSCAVAWVREVLCGVVNHPRIDGMQGVRGSNPLSSTPGHRPSPPSTARELPASGSKSAANCLREANLVVRHAVDAGQHRQCRRPVDQPPPGRRHQPGRGRRRPDRPRIHSISPGVLVAVLA